MFEPDCLQRSRSGARLGMCPAAWKSQWTMSIIAICHCLNRSISRTFPSGVADGGLFFCGSFKVEAIMSLVLQRPALLFDPGRYAGA